MKGLKLTENVEMYLKIIYLLETKTGDPARTGNISKLLRVSPASVTEMLDRMQDNGLVRHKKYKGATTTLKGRAIARKIMQKHCLLERFLIESLGVKNLKTAHQQADAMEHVLRDDIAMRLRKIVKVPRSCPDCYDIKHEICSEFVRKRKSK